jgi:hypothetical protein
MTIKRTILTVLCAVLCLVIAAGTFSCVQDRRADNIFDDMYQYVNHHPGTYGDFGSANTHFYLVPCAEVISDSDMPDFYWGGYDQKALRNGEKIDIVVNLKEQTLLVTGVLKMNNGYHLLYSYWYYFNTKTLEIEPLKTFSNDINEPSIDSGSETSAFLHEYQISRETIEYYRDYFLYDKLLTDWINDDGNHTRFTAKNYGRLKIIDNTFANLGEDWSL